ncbi:MAG: T9SS type A sorting domain-containing protein [Candidatus Latescibacterota bacterium]
MGIYGQKIDMDGNFKWLVGGIRVGLPYPENWTWIDPTYRADGVGGVFIVFMYGDSWSPDIHVQRLDASGAHCWADSGIAVSALDASQHVPILMTSGEGRAIVVWTDGRLGNSNIYAQQFDVNGQALWSENGQPVCEAPGSQGFVKMASDGDGGAYFTWWDGRDDDNHVYVQHMTESGDPLWSLEGRRITTTPSVKNRYPRIISDAAGGAIVTWHTTVGVDRHIFAQRIDRNGTSLWPSDGVLIMVEPNNKGMHTVIPDDAGGAIISATIDIDTQDSYDNDINAQRIDPMGNKLWGDTGILMDAAMAVNSWVHPVSDGKGGCYFFWTDYRQGRANIEIYGQRIDRAGNTRWENDGVCIIRADSSQYLESVASDGEGGAIISWVDLRNDAVSWEDLYAYRIRGSIEVTFAIQQGSCPNIIGMGNRKDKDNGKANRGVLNAAILGSESVDVADIDVESVMLEGVPALRWTVKDQLSAGPARKHNEDRSYAAGGKRDSKLAAVAEFRCDDGEHTDTCHCDHRGTDYSHMCTCSYQKADGFNDLLLTFDRKAVVDALGEIARGEVYPVSVEGVLKDGTEFRGSDCVMVVIGNGNGIDGADDDGADELAGETATDKQMSLGIASPNPFNPVTRIHYYVPEATRVQLAVYNVDGRLVAKLVDGEVNAGPHSVTWDAKSAASGVYFCRLNAQGFEQTQKIVFMK